MGDHPALDYHEAQHGNWFATASTTPTLETPPMFLPNGNTSQRNISSYVVKPATTKKKCLFISSNESVPLSEELIHSIKNHQCGTHTLGIGLGDKLQGGLKRGSPLGSLTSLICESQERVDHALVGNVPGLQWSNLTISENEGGASDRSVRRESTQTRNPLKPFKRFNTSPAFVDLPITQKVSKSICTGALQIRGGRVEDEDLSDMIMGGSPEVIVEKTLAELEKTKRQILASHPHPHTVPHDFLKLHGKPHAPHISQNSQDVLMSLNSANTSFDNEIFEMEKDKDDHPETVFEKCASAFFSQPFAQNWFFRKDSNDSIMDTYDDSRRNTDSSLSEESQIASSLPSPGDSFMRGGLIRTRTFPNKLSDMNTWVPQNF